MRPDDRAVAVYRVDIGSRRVMREHELASGAGRLVGAEEKTSQRVRIDMAFKSHGGTALNVQYDAISVILGRRDSFSACFPGQFEKVAPIEFI